MKRAVALLIILSITQPVYAGIVTDFEPVEQELIETEKELEKELEESLKVIEKKKERDKAKERELEQIKAEKKPSSRKWLWIIGGVLLAGGAAAAAGGGDGGGDGNGTGTIDISW